MMQQKLYRYISYQDLFLLSKFWLIKILVPSGFWGNEILEMSFLESGSLIQLDLDVKTHSQQ